MTLLSLSEQTVTNHVVKKFTVLPVAASMVSTVFLYFVFSCSFNAAALCFFDSTTFSDVKETRKELISAGNNHRNQ